jgi:hypothetical protein
MNKWTRLWRGAALSSALALAAAPALADETLRIPRAAHPPVLADYLAGAPADAGVEVSGFRQYEPGDGEPATQPTRAFLSYDDKFFYAVFICKDDPALVRARIARRDDLIGDDAVELLLDTFHDKQRAFHFYVNPYGVQMDGQETEGLDSDYDFDTRWESDGRLTADGWVAMMAIPFKSLRFRVGPKQEWGVAVGRILARESEFAYWPFVTQHKEGFIPQLATAEIDDAIVPGRNVQLIPYVYANHSRTLNKDDPNHPVWQTDDKPQAGLDAKFVLDDAFAVDLTLNPDFSEVESDDPQVLINQRYEVQFPEKRPIFLENSGFFGTPQQLFYSRQVVDPQYGARVTGRKDDWSIGGLLINDEAPGRLLAADDPDFGKTAKVGVLRLQKDVNASSNVGLFVSDRTLGSKTNLVGDLDSRVKLDDNWVLTGQVAASRFDDDGARTNGRLGALSLTRADRNFNYTGQYLDVSPGFTADLGYIPRVDIRQTTQTASYLWIDNEAPWLKSYGPALTAVGTWDHAGTLQDWSTDASFVFNGPTSTSLEAHLLNGYELFEGVGFHKSGFEFVASTYRLRWLTPTLKFGQADSVNYQPAVGVAPFLGKGRNVSLDLQLTLGPSLRIQQTLLWNDLHTRAAIGGLGSGAAVYRELLSRTKFTYQYNRFLAAHLIVDNNSLATNARLNALADDKQRNIDVLFSYVPSPGTELYVGYSTLRQNLQLVGSPPVVTVTPQLAMSTGHQVFMKYSVLF